MKNKIKKPEIKFERKVIKLKDIKMDPTNPNSMTDIKQAGLKKSFDRFGYVDEICIEKGSMLMADGEHRLKELLDEGVEEAEVKMFVFENTAERILFRQTKNKARGIHDPEKDKEDFRFLDEHDELTNLAEYLGEDEADFDYEEEDLPEDQEKNELDVEIKREVTCPSCKTTFKIDKKEK